MNEGHTRKFTLETCQAFLEEIMAKTTSPLIIIQDGARYLTGQAMKEFFARNCSACPRCADHSPHNRRAHAE